MKAPKYQVDQTEMRLEAQRLALRALGISTRESRTYSIARAIASMAERGTTTGYESEVETEMRKKHRSASNGSILIPTGIPLSRDMTVATASNGGHLVGTTLQAGSFIDLLRERLVFSKLGATFLTGLVGNVAIPKQTNSATAYWLANEATAITESNQVLGQLTMSPKNVGAYTEVSRQLLIQSTPGVDTVIANDLAAVLADAIDTAVISGTGTNGQPSGLKLASGLASFSAASCNLAKLLDAAVDVATANALGPSCAYFLRPNNAAVLMQRFANATYGSDPLWQGNLLEGRVNNFRAVGTNRVDAAEMLFGAVDSIVIGEWNVLELAVNPFAGFSAGIVGIRAIQSVDVGFRYPGAFTLATDFS